MTPPPTASLTLVEQAAIGWACERLIHHYAMLNDAGDFHAMAALFTEDGAFARPTQPDALIHGRAAILASFLGRPARYTRHLITSVVITVEDAEHAAGRSYLSLHTGQAGETLPRQDQPAYLIGDFHDRFRLEDGVWKFSERRGSLALRVGCLP
jgi:3-phenylpropionate/cinnamic acid dioxygenase small subunit